MNISNALDYYLDSECNKVWTNSKHLGKKPWCVNEDDINLFLGETGWTNLLGISYVSQEKTQWTAEPLYPR